MWLVGWFALVGAREFRLDPRVTTIHVDGLAIGAVEIDRTRFDFGVILEVRNTGEVPVRITDLWCGRGDRTTPVDGDRATGFDLDVDTTARIPLLCRLGAEAGPGYGVRFGAVHDAAGAPLLGAVRWWLDEDALRAERQAEGRQLASGSFVRAPE
ncbi:MAG: hypothetical protein ABMB14_37380 [Myxococcota bacterium]